MGILDWLFGGDDDAKGTKVDKAIIDQRIEQVVNMVDPRLKFVVGYHDKLAGAVEQAVLYCRELEGKIPPAIAASAAAWTDSPLLRALFATAPDVPAVFSRSNAVQDLFATTPGAEDAYAMLRFVIREEQCFGMRVEGEVVQREVAQTAVAFRDKQVPLALATEGEARLEMRRRAFRFLVTEALEQITTASTERKDLIESRSMLQARLGMLRRNRSSMESVLNDASDVHVKIEALEELLAINERSLKKFPTVEGTLDHMLERIVIVLTHGDEYLRLKPLSYRLDAMNIVVPSGIDQPASELVLPELSAKDKQSISLLVARFPRSELIPREEVAREARRLLS